jgi:hypothetical protein
MNVINDSSLVLYLPLHERDGAAVRAADQYGRACAVAGAAWRPQGRRFDGVDDLITLGSDLALYPARFTWEFWWNIDATASNEAVLGTPPAVREPWGILPQSGGFIDCAVRQSDLTQVNVSFTDLIVKGVGWVHFAFTGDGAVLRGYRDTRPSAVTGAYDGTLDLAGRQPLALGVTRSYIWWLNGTIGEVRLYNRALAPAELERNYLATKWRYR